MCISQFMLDSIKTNQDDKARINLTKLELWYYFFSLIIHVCMNVFSDQFNWLLNHDFTDSDSLNSDWLNSWKCF